MSGVGVLGTGDIFGTLVIGSLLIVDTEVDSCSRFARVWYMVGTAVGDSADVCNERGRERKEQNQHTPRCVGHGRH